MIRRFWNMSIRYESYDHFFIAEVGTRRVRWGGALVEYSQQARLFRQFDASIHASIQLEILESSPKRGIRAIILFGGDLSGLEVLRYLQCLAQSFIYLL